jgi:hypothetical protein
MIMSDQDKALGIAITKVFPGSQHLLCIWHIEGNLKSNYNQCFPSGTFTAKGKSKLVSN